MNILQSSIILLAASSFMAFAGEKIDKSMTVKDVTSVEVENLRGQVKIVGKSTDTIKVKGELDDDAEGFTFEQNGSVVLIKVEMPRHLSNNWSRNETKLEVSLPEHLNVSFSGVSTDLALSGIKADVNANSVSGNIKIDDVGKRLEVSSVSGDIMAKNLGKSTHLSSVSGNVLTSGSSGQLFVKTVSGDIDATTTATQVEAKNVSGEIELSLGDVDELVMSTVSGDVDVDLALNDDGKIKLSSVSGDFELNFTNDVQAIFRLRANAGGDLINRLTNDRAVEDKYGPSSRLSFETGNGSSRVNGSTVSGNVELNRK